MYTPIECPNKIDLAGILIPCGKCDVCSDNKAEQDKRDIQKSSRPTPPPTANTSLVIPPKVQELPEKPQLDYKAIFLGQQENLIRDGINPNEVNSDEAGLAMLAEIDKRTALLELALEELRYRKQAHIVFRDGILEKLTETKRREVSQQDSALRAKKIEEKVQREITLKKLQATKFADQMQRAGFSAEEIRGLLKKRGLDVL